MKKIILFASLLALTIACTKTEEIKINREVVYNVASRLSTKVADGVIYNNGDFGSYGWFTGTGAEASTNTTFMTNERIALASGEWKPADHTFYWPKSGYIDFISYSPFAGTSATAGTVPAITASSITYSSYTVSSVDLMYADKARCSSNVDLIKDGEGAADSGYTGVPTLFRHALAKVGFSIRASFLEYGTAPDRTTWEINVSSVKIKGLKTTGSCALTLNADGKSWDKPVTTVSGTDYNVWTSLSGSSSEQELVNSTTYSTGVNLTTTAQTLESASGFVIPQMLEAGTQQIELTMHITTHLANGLTIEEDYNPTIDLKDISSLQAWQMNENIIYTIKIKPVAYVSSYDNPTDVIITYDPAVVDWTTVDAGAVIQL